MKKYSTLLSSSETELIETLCILIDADSTFTRWRLEDGIKESETDECIEKLNEIKAAAKKIRKVLE